MQQINVADFEFIYEGVSENSIQQCVYLSIVLAEHRFHNTNRFQPKKYHITHTLLLRTAQRWR